MTELLLSSSALQPLRTQVAKKATAKGRLTQLKIDDLSITPYPVLTSAEAQSDTWTQLLKETPLGARKTFGTFDFRDSPLFAMTALSSARDFFFAKLQAGEIGAEYVGNHGVGGLLWPPLEYYDEHVRACPCPDSREHMS